MTIIGRFLFSVTMLLVTLAFEILLAMALYIYLATYHVAAFGTLVRWARDALIVAADGLETFFPDFTNQAYATLLGELGPKSILLLFLGLFASGVIRAVLWGVRTMALRARRIGGSAV